MLSILLNAKSMALLHRISYRESLLLTDKQTCDELRREFDLSRGDFEKVISYLHQSGYVYLIQDSSMVVLTFTEMAKAAVASPFQIEKGGVSDEPLRIS